MKQFKDGIQFKDGTHLGLFCAIGFVLSVFGFVLGLKIIAFIYPDFKIFLIAFISMW